MSPTDEFRDFIQHCYDKQPSLRPEIPEIVRWLEAALVTGGARADEIDVSVKNDTLSTSSWRREPLPRVSSHRYGMKYLLTFLYSSSLVSRYFASLAAASYKIPSETPLAEPWTLRTGKTLLGTTASSRAYETFCGVLCSGPGIVEPVSYGVTVTGRLNFQRGAVIKRTR